MIVLSTDYDSSHVFFKSHVVQLCSLEPLLSSIFKRGNSKRDACNRIDYLNVAEMGLQRMDIPNFDEGINVKDKHCCRTPTIDISSNFEDSGKTYFKQDYEKLLEIMASDAEKTSNPVHENNEPSTIEGDLQVENNEVSAAVPAHNMTTTISYLDISEENRKKCLQIEGRIERLSRRLKLKQSKLYGLHVSEQINGVFDFCRCQIVDRQSTATEGSRLDLSMDVYLKRLKQCSDQSCVPQLSEKSLNYFGSGRKEFRNGRNISMSVVPKLNVDVHEHIERISGELRAQVEAITNDLDSDVTASSSGEDSLDEETQSPTPTPLKADAMEDHTNNNNNNDNIIKKLPLKKRAIYRWLRNRASVAYRLSWLHSRMCALEYKIHHYTEIYKKLRSSKGPVTLQKDTSSSPGSTTPSVPTAGAPLVLNGYLGSSPVTAAAVASPLKRDAADELEDTCSRTCPIMRDKFRKRNLIKLDTLNMNSSRSSSAKYLNKYSTVRCDCVASMSCVLCAVRGPGVDLSYQHIYSNLLAVQSKIALVDPAYHPVLSLPSDVSVNTHISSLLNNKEDVVNVCGKAIKNRSAPPVPVKKNYYSNYKTTEEIRIANSEGLEKRKKRKYIRRKPLKPQSMGLSRSQLGKQRHSKLDKALSLRKRRRKLLTLKRYKTRGKRSDESPQDSLYHKKDREEVNSSQPSSPHSSHSSTVKEPMKRKRSQSYDIDNFIIPPNSNPVAVVEKPQYKEISIPVWKIIDERLEPKGIDREFLPTHILEDLSDDHVTKFHAILELNERKKYRPHAFRRSRKRTESCPESSEANTPERVASPPASVSSESNDATAPSSAITTGTNNKNRIPAPSKKNNMDCDNSSVSDTTSSEVVPYVLRVFPLSDEDYKELLASHLNTKMEDVQSDVDSENDNIKPEGCRQLSVVLTKLVPQMLRG